MIKFLKNIFFHFKKPPVIIITGERKEFSSQVIFEILKNNFKIDILENHNPKLLNILRKNIFIFKSEIGESNFGFFAKLIKNSRLPIMILTDIDKSSLEMLKWSKKVAREIPSNGFLVLNNDNEVNREFKGIVRSNIFDFGFSGKSLFRVTDIKKNKELNFKLIYKGKIIPFWNKYFYQKKRLYDFLSGICVGDIFDINLIELSKKIEKI